MKKKFCVVLLLSLGFAGGVSGEETWKIPDDAKPKRKRGSSKR